MNSNIANNLIDPKYVKRLFCGRKKNIPHKRKLPNYTLLCNKKENVNKQDLLLFSSGIAQKHPRISDNTFFTQKENNNATINPQINNEKDFNITTNISECDFSKINIEYSLFIF